MSYIKSENEIDASLFSKQKKNRFIDSKKVMCCFMETMNVSGLQGSEEKIENLAPGQQ